MLLSVRPSVRVSVCLSSVCPSVAYIANNSRTQRRSMPKFGRKVPHLRCDSHTSFKVKRSKVRVTDGRGHTVSAESGGHTACSSCFGTLLLNEDDDDDDCDDAYCFLIRSDMLRALLTL